MRTLLIVWSLTAVVPAAVVSPQTAAQDPHAQMQMRGEATMGFDLEKTTHHFYLYPDGGAIEIAVKDAKDTVNRDAIRAHLPHVAMMFGAGDFSAPQFIHGDKVPGAADMAALKDRLKFTYRETPVGGRVDIDTKDPDALKALHAFLRYQITEHKTGDSLDLSKARR